METFNLLLHYYLWTKSFPLDTEHKLDVNKTLIGRSGRFLKVLCKFGLPLVSGEHELYSYCLRSTISYPFKKPIFLAAISSWWI